MTMVDFPVAILAGGLATRLRPITEKIPKSLVAVAGRSFLAHQIELLRDQGLRHLVLCVSYLGEMIQREFGDGSKWGVRLEYSFDGEQLLGTGGALRNALPLLGKRFFVLYGDSYLPIEFKPVAEFFQKSSKRGLMTVFKNDGLYDSSNVWFADGAIKIYDKQRRLPEMQHIDFGLSMFSAAAFDETPDGKKFDLVELMLRLLAQNQLAGYEVKQRFYEIGSPAGLAELEEFLSRKTDQQQENA